MRRNFTIFLVCLPFFFISISSIAQGLVINEVVPISDGAYSDEDGDHSDWIEIRNMSDQSIQLAGYTLSDDEDELDKWNFPEYTLDGFGHIVVFCSNKNRETQPFHTNFKLKSSGEPVILSNDQGEIIDEVAPTALSEGFALARICYDACYWDVLDTQSPGEDNMAQSLVAFSIPSGVFEDDLNLELDHPFGHEIRYTLDGSVPNAESLLYSGSISLTDASDSEVLISDISTSAYWSNPTGELLQINTVRAQAFLAGVPTTQVFTKTYAIGEQAVALFNEYPVFSMQTNADSLFDSEYGIHVPGVNFDPGNSTWSGNYYMRGPEWERDVHIEYFENAQLAWSQSVGIRIHGGKTRGAPQKSFRFYARDDLGAGEFNHKFFETKEKTVFDKLLLRCHLGCWNKTVIKDEVTAYVAKDLNFETQHSRPCVMFINGEYWGLFAIRDFYDAQYIEEEHGYHKDSVDILNHGSGYRPNVDPDWGVFEGDNLHYAALMDFLENADMTLIEDYNYVSTQMDLSSMIDYYSTQVYFAQKDWPAGNHKVWRGGGESKWQWMLFDTDASWGYLGASNNTMLRATATNSSNYSNPPWATFLFRKLLESPVFVEDFKKRYACLLKNEFSVETIEPIIDRFVDLYSPGMPRNIDRWHHVSSMADWMGRINSKLYAFSEDRRGYTEGHFTDYFGTEFNPDDYDCDEFVTNSDEIVVSEYFMKVYPNPASDQIWVDSPIEVNGARLKIYDSLGKQLHIGDYQFHQTIDISDFNPGVYIVIIEQGNAVVSSRFIKY